MQNTMVTIIGSSYFEPIAMLFENLEQCKSPTKSKVQVSSHENGYAASVCVLTVACLESYVMRVRYINHPSDLGEKHRSVLEYLTNLYSDFPYAEELMELFIVRDLLVHNHLWEMDYSWGDNPGLVQHSLTKHSSGDSKYRKNVGSIRQETSKLALHVNPVRVGRSDAKTILCWAWRVLQFLEVKNNDQCCVSIVPVAYKGEVKPLSDWMDVLCGNT